MFSTRNTLVGLLILFGMAKQEEASDVCNCDECR